MIKESVLDKLINSKTEYISGEKISRQLNVSRTAVCKAIKALRQQGYNIESSTKKGYRFLDSPDILSEYEIRRYLNSDIIGKKIVVHESIDSTNRAAKELAEQGAPEGTVIIANEQTSGKGRFSRSFFSPPDKGIWMTVILRPLVEPSKATIFTVIAALAVNNAVQKLYGSRLQIKWTNDLLFNYKKVSGILTEMNIEAETNTVQYVVIGIGINVSTKKEDFPKELKDNATSLLQATKKAQKRAKLAATILNELEALYKDSFYLKNKSLLLALYRNDLCMLGKEVRLIQGNSQSIVTAVDIDKNGALIVRKGDKSIATVNSGEVSLKLEEDA